MHPQQLDPMLGAGQSYLGPAGFYDELADAFGQVRGPWQLLMSSLARLGSNELVARSQDGRRLIREHGVTYSVYGDPKGMDRAWGLDLLPLLLTAAEWKHLHAGLEQRSRLLNLILADLYVGSQVLLRNGFIPPELVYANPGFLRACRGIHVPIFLHLYACDLGRSPDGQWWVISDRTQAAGGAGYAWENRTVLSRLLPDEVRSLRARPLAEFFSQQRSMLAALARRMEHPPNIVLLTPGPHHEIYFEHAYFARQLGFPLVEGADLVVRDRRVYLKTVEGLQRVDVLLRRVDDNLCDPLELRSDSFLGVAGLVDAVRAGEVAIANALGSGLAESPALLALLPELCRHLLGEELLLPSIQTWWCGRSEELRYVLDNLDTLIIKPAFSKTSAPALPSLDEANGTAVNAARRDQLRATITAAPHAFVAQHRFKLSHAPVWTGSDLQPRPVIVRTFVAQAGDRMAVMPGGLARVSESMDDLVPSLAKGSGDSKDIWVLPAPGEPDRGETESPRDQDLREPVVRGLPSRAADHLFWLGRYTERLEQLLRVLRAFLGHMSGEGASRLQGSQLAELAVNLGVLSDLAELQVAPERLTDGMLGLLYHHDKPAGVHDLVAKVRSSASAVRDRFSGDTWRILGRLDADANSGPTRLPLAGATALLHTLVLDLAAFNGMEMENMTRGHGWRFLDLGRRLERGLSILRLVRAACQCQGMAAVVLESILEIADCVMTYRRLYFDRRSLSGLIAVLLRDKSNPRSLAFQVQLICEHVRALVAETREGPALPLDTLTDRLKRMQNDKGICETRSDTETLVHHLDDWLEQLAAVSDQVTNRYFSHSVPRPT
jgi:uncharacterized circularly permuted ATP-grasp superfamily protein/uncharacterized alpha-E superfamily protein